MKVTMEMNRVLIEQGDLLHKNLEQFFRARFFLEFIYFVTDGSFTADVGPLQPTEGEKKHDKRRFRGAKVCTMATGIRHDCVVTLQDAHTNDNMTTSTDFHIV